MRSCSFRPTCSACAWCARASTRRQRWAPPTSRASASDSGRAPPSSTRNGRSSASSSRGGVARKSRSCRPAGTWRSPGPGTGRARARAVAAGAQGPPEVLARYNPNSTKLEEIGMAPRKGYGGKTVYGARVGILMLDTKWPRPPGDTGNALTWPFPVLYKVVKGASARVVIHEQGKGLGPAFLDAAAELVKEGADGITTTGGFLAIFQKELAAHVQVPVASSSLMQIPVVQRLLPPGKRVGVLSVQGDRITS